MLNFCISCKNALERFLPLCHGAVTGMILSYSWKLGPHAIITLGSYLLYLIFMGLYFPKIWRQLAFELSVRKAIIAAVPYDKVKLPTCKISASMLVVGGIIGLLGGLNNDTCEVILLGTTITTTLVIVVFMMMLALWRYLSYSRLKLIRQGDVFVSFSFGYRSGQAFIDTVPLHAIPAPSEDWLDILKIH